MKLKASPALGLLKYGTACLKFILLMIGATAILFVLMNLAAQFFIDRLSHATPNSLFNLVLQPDSQIGIPVLKNIFNVGTKEEALERAKSAPSFEMHPGLHYMTARANNKHYRIGLEGIRYDEGWDDQFVRNTLDSGKPLIFLMGGSTVLGHGVSANETISSHLNKLLAPSKQATVLNFGSQAYDQQRAIEKLVYLLREGYRPQQVIFLDGWNDLAGLARSNMRWQDKVIFHGFAVNRGKIAFTPEAHIGAVNMTRLFVESLPITRAIERRNWQSINVDTIKSSRDPFIDGFDFAEADWMFFNWEIYAQRNKERLKTEIIESYKNNLRMINGLSKAFGFKVSVIFQPFGLFDDSNPFVPLESRKTESYKFLEAVNTLVRSEIKNGNLPMIDASNVLSDLNEHRYVDVAHYSPSANMRLAKHMSALINAKESP